MILRSSIKFHQFIDKNNFFKLNSVCLIFDTPFFANFSHIQKYAAEFELLYIGQFFYKYTTVINENLS